MEFYSESGKEVRAAMEKDKMRNLLRIQRRLLRDSTDPFNIPEVRFNKLFGLNKETAMLLLNELSPHMQTGIRKTFIPKSMRLVATLYFYATGLFLRDVGRDSICAMSKTMVSRIVKEVTYLIQDKLMDKYIQFPTTCEEQNVIKERFIKCTGFPGVIGAIGGTHIRIKKPLVTVEHCYRNREGFFSKNVQLICDYDLRILACYARFGGNTTKAYIWERSQVQSLLEDQYRLGVDNCWLIGDADYPLQPWLMTPFTCVESKEQEKYNRCHARARSCVQRLSGVLKKLFACLSDERGLLVEPAYSGAIINACLTLHNFRKHYNLAMPEIVIRMESEDVPAEGEYVEYDSVEDSTEGCIEEEYLDEYNSDEEYDEDPLDVNILCDAKAIRERIKYYFK